jgi:hypothetical protein
MRLPIPLVLAVILPLSWVSICAGQANVGAAQEDAGAGAAAAVAISRPPPATRVEALLLKKRIVLVRGYTEIATLQADDGSAVRITAIELIDTTQRAREYGLAIEVSKGERHVVAYVDHDEIDEIVAAVGALSRFDNSASRMANFEASYRSRGGIDLTSFTDNGTRYASVRATQYLDPSNQLLVATASFRLVMLPDLARNLSDAKQVLDKAKAAE